LNNLFKRAAVALLCSFAAIASAATIDKMYTSTFGHYTQQYSPGGSFMIFSQADHYQLSDGTTWDSGAGWHPAVYSTVASVHVSGDRIFYVFNAPAGGVLFQNTDYDSGDHSAQGVLGAPSHLILSAKIGSSRGTMFGYTTVISNDATWYGEPRFNFYSAPVGSEVFFKETFTLSGASFSTDLFDTSFTYNESGFVDFTRLRNVENMAAVPEPSTYLLLLGGIAALVAFRRKAAAR
jgi:hypothetical protein